MTRISGGSWVASLGVAALLWLAASGQGVAGENASTARDADICAGGVPPTQVSHVRFVWRRVPEVSNVQASTTLPCLAKRGTWIVMLPDEESDPSALAFIDNRWGLTEIEASGSLRCVGNDGNGLGHLGLHRCEFVVTRIHAATAAAKDKGGEK